MFHITPFPFLPEIGRTRSHISTTNIYQTIKQMAITQQVLQAVIFLLMILKKIVQQ